MNINSYGRLTPSIIKDFENQIDLSLPDDYKDFLAKTNGGRLINQVFHIDELDRDVLMHVFYGVGIDDDKVLNLDFWFKKYRDEIPEESLLIGNDQGGGFILYVIGGEEFGLYYYDHSHQFGESSKEKNTYYLAETFREFAESFVTIR